jgi:hypothetical protein
MMQDCGISQTPAYMSLLAVFPSVTKQSTGIAPKREGLEICSVASPDRMLLLLLLASDETSLN